MSITDHHGFETFNGFPMPKYPQALVDRDRRPIVRSATREPRTGLECSFSARATLSAQKRGMAWLTSPASSMKSVGEPYSRARQDK